MLAAPNDQLASLVCDSLRARSWIRRNVTAGVDVRYHYHRLHCPPTASALHKSKRDEAQGEESLVQYWLMILGSQFVLYKFINP
jgi:hypothetical protein